MHHASLPPAYNEATRPVPKKIKNQTLIYSAADPPSIDSLTTPVVYTLRLQLRI